MTKVSQLFLGKIKSDSKVVVTLLTLVIILLGFFSSPVVLALEGAKWTDNNKNTITYNDKIFTKADDSSLPNDLKGKTVYIRRAAGQDSNGVTPYDAIVVKSGSNDKIDGELKNFSLSIHNKPISDSTSGTAKEAAEEEIMKTDCAVEGGAGWIVCTLSNSIASFMDGLYGILQSFLDVQPLKVTERNGLFQVWDYMRNIANVIFAILFIFVVHAQVTNIGISNYGIKKILPKLIVAAVLINLSYYMCSILIDLSNILGYRVQDLMVNIRKELFVNGINAGATFDNLDWRSVTATLLSGVGVISWGAYSFRAAGSLSTLPWMILLVLLPIVYAALVAVVVLAARQALITILVFLAPLAFAANILPNTEKWFDKWKDVFATMLFMYPMMALLFGGSQLAGTVIIANANGNLFTLILGMAVQVVPLAITPAIIKLSGSMLGKFAGIINNPNKGPIDSARNYLEDRKQIAFNRRVDAENARAASLYARGIGNGRPGFFSTAGIHQRRYNRRRTIDSIGSSIKDYQEGHFNDKQTRLQNQIAEARQDGNIAKANRLIAKSIQLSEMAAADFKDQMTNSAKDSASKFRAEIFKKTLVRDANNNVVSVDNNAVQNLDTTSSVIHNSALRAKAHAEAERGNNMAYTNAVAETLKVRSDLSDIAEGIRGLEGRNAALASAITESSKLHETEISESTNLLKHIKPDKGQLATLSSGYLMDVDASGKLIEVTDASGNKIKVGHIKKNGMEIGRTPAMIESAQDSLMKVTTALESLNMLSQTAVGDILHKYRSATVKAFLENKKDNPFINRPMLEEIALNGMSEANVKAWISRNINSKLSADNIITSGGDVIEDILFSAVTNSGYMSGHKASSETIANLIVQLHNINTNSSLSSKIDAGKGSKIHKIIDHIKRHETSAYNQAINSIIKSSKSQHPGKNITADDIDTDFSNIRKN